MKKNKSIKELFCFALSGVFGFAADTFVLYILKDVLGLYLSRCVSFSCAVFVTWFFNKKITFKYRCSNCSASKEFVSYFGLMLIGGVVNYGVFVMTVSQFSLPFQYPVIGVALGSLAGMMFNWATAKTFIFKYKKM